MDQTGADGVVAPPPTHQSVGSVAAALWRHKVWIIVPTVTAFLLSLAIVNLLTSRYTGEARVLLENRDTVYSRPDRDMRGADPAIDPEAVASQVQAIMSKDLALKVIRDMGLARRAEYDPVQRGLGLAGTVLVALGFTPDPRQVPQEERVLDTYFKRLLVYPAGKSRVITIEFQSEDPKIAADVANRIAEEYLRREEGAKNETSRASSDWLDKAIEPLMKKVSAAEAKVEAFRTAKGLFVSSANTTITTQQLSELNTQLSLARSQQADLQARAKLIREALRLGKAFETSEVINNELVRRLLEQRAALKATIAYEERTLLPGHPRMKELVAQLADLESQVRAAAERAARALDNDARAAGARVASMQAELDRQKKTTALSNEDEVQLKALEREAAALREQLNSYRNKFLDAAARASENAQTADARVISRAFPQSEPTFPKKLPIVLLATLGTMVLASALIATQALMARQMQPGYPDLTGMDVMPAGPFPWEKSEPRLAGFALPFGLGRRKRAAPAVEAESGAAAPPRAPAAERVDAADALARELALMDFDGHGKMLVLFGCGQEAHGRLAALRVARRLARDGACIIVDLLGSASGRRGNLYDRLLPPGSVGLGAWLDRHTALGGIIHRDSRSPLHVIPSGGTLHRRAASSGMREDIAMLAEALRHAYAHVVIDAGIVGGPGEFFADLGDAILLVARMDEDEDYLARVSQRLESLRGAPVFVLPEENAAEFAAANDSIPVPHAEPA